MVIDSLTNKKTTMKELIDIGEKQNAFDEEIGWKHKGLIQIADRFNINGSLKLSSVNNICREIQQNHFVIASVSPQLGEKDTPIKNFGHLALVSGFKIKNNKIEGVFINNPSGREDNLREKTHIPIKRFEEGYNNRIIVLYENTQSKN